MTTPACDELVTQWNGYRMFRGDLVLLLSCNEVAVLNGFAHVTGQGEAVIELLRLGRWPLADLAPIRGKDLRYLDTFVRCDHCGARPLVRCAGKRVHPQRRSALIAVIDRRMGAILRSAALT